MLTGNGLAAMKTAGASQTFDSGQTAVGLVGGWQRCLLYPKATACTRVGSLLAGSGATFASELMVDRLLEQ
jgi:hypothetical protein